MLLTHVYTLPNNKIPIDDVPPERWLLFVRAHYRPDHGIPANIHTNRIGIFDLSVRRLCDLGIMENPILRNVDGKTVWFAKWRGSENLERLLTDHTRQYNLFCESIADYAEKSEILNNVGVSIDGFRLSLSGLLTLAHRGGIRGAVRYLRSEKCRKEFSETKRLLEQSNTIF